MKSDHTLDTIYVRLLNEGTDVWRPVSATKLSSDTFLITPNSKNYHPLDESWQFLPGQVVRIRTKNFSDGEALEAFELVENSQSSS